MSADLERLNLELEVARATGHLKGTARGVAMNLRDFYYKWDAGIAKANADKLDAALADLDAATKALAAYDARRAAR